MNDASVTIDITNTVADAALAQELAPRMAKFGQALGARMQRLVPKRSWALHDTIESDTTTSGSTVTTTITFGGGLAYGLAVERGTSKQRAQPFARPALLQSKMGDLNYSGKGITRHGVVTISTRRSRTRARRTGTRR